jgi:hypothetical protein
MSDTETLIYPDAGIERSTISFPAGLWMRARRTGLDMRVSATQLVVEGLALRLDEIEGKVKIQRIDGK